MFIRPFPLVLLMLSATLALGQALHLSENAQISIITCGPYQGELYSAFGHSAIRVYDPALRIDRAYNYGVFDFDQPNFYLNFARGHSYYKLGVYPYPWFRDIYISYNRFLHEQVLNLTPVQKQKVFDFLEWNALPENSSYLYDYFYDNCATRVRDVFMNVLKEEVAFDSTFITTQYTIRELTDLYLQEQPWGDLGIDICLGLPMDKTASPFEYMFLPDYIEYSFDHALVKNDSATMPLVKEKISVYESVPQEPFPALPHPLWFFGCFFAVVAAFTYRDWKQKKLTRWLDVTLLLVTGSIGLLLLLLWVATSHQAAAQNFNLLWALPTHLLAVPLYISNHKWAGAYFQATFVITALLLLCWLLLPQQLHLFLIPVAAAFLLRWWVISWWMKNGARAV